MLAQLRNLALLATAFVASLSVASAVCSAPTCTKVTVFRSNGADVAGSFSTSSLQCMRNEGALDFLIVRSWHSYGGFDSSGPVTIRNAHAAGIKYVDAYLFPCAGKSAASQVKGAISGLDNAGAKFGTMWLDIEVNPSRGCGWGANKATNCEFIKEMINEGHALGRTIGVYSSPYEWSTVAGNCNIRGSYSDVPLWYAHYDNSKSFNDYSRFAFGGWSKPSIKQYTDSLRICGGAFDGDWY